ncbi:3-phosphoshikimate 1-carboxyvinyltransferase [soil metagenome]
MTTLAVEPLHRPPDATVSVPGSKSITNRALLAAAMAEGHSTLRGALVADDTEAMAECLRRLGVRVDAGPEQTGVHGSAGRLGRGPASLDARLSGTTSRFLLPALALGPDPVTLDGRPPLRARPFGPLFDALRHLGASVDEGAEAGHLPVTVQGPVQGGRVQVPGDVSSQFLSGLFLAAPAMAQGLEIELTTPLVSRPYVEMTRRVMGAFGVEVEVDEDGHRWSVGPDRYAATDLAIEPDASAAAYLFAAAAITGGRVRVAGLGRNSAQSDVGFVEVLARMGAQLRWDDDAVVVAGGAALHCVDVDLADLSDTAQTLAAVAVFADSPTQVRGIGFVRGKETDRIAAVVTELRRCGIAAEETDDGFVVHPGTPRPAVVRTYDDHRMAMSFALLGLRVPGIAIEDPGCVAKTFPGFWSALDSLRSSP